MKLHHILLEVEQEAAVNALEKAMADSFKQLGQELEADKQTVQADVQAANIKVTEAVGVVTVIGALLAAPKVIELLAKGMQKLFNVYKGIFKKGAAKDEQEQLQVAKALIEFSHKWHKVYPKGIKWILKVSGLFKKAGIKSEQAQMKAAELVYYTILAGLAVYSGVGAVSAFKSAAASVDLGDFSIGTFETAMAAIKSGEVATFLSRINIK
jgi:hypothetical protein